MRRLIQILIGFCIILPINEAAFAQERLKISGIEIPVSKFKAARGGKPERPTYYGYHLPPASRSPSPYVIIIPSSREDVIERDDFIVEMARWLVKNGYGAVVIDINRGITGSQFYNGLVKAPPRSIGALSFLQYIREEYPHYSNGKFGAFGRSKGGETTIELNKAEQRDDVFFYRNVTYWFDAMGAYYPSCGDNTLMAPQLVIIGEADDWTSPANCRGWQKNGNTTNLDVIYLPDATHAFDNPGFAKPRIVRGHSVRYSKAATETAREALLSFFDAHLKFPPMEPRAAQQALTDRGYAPGAVDGAWGKKSVEALKRFQADNGMPATGLLDEESQTRLAGR